MKSAYCKLHSMGYAHCFEAWRDGELVGGLYGVAIGRVFFGESMFARETDASKVAFAAAVGYLARRDFRLIDCQVESRHMATLGATLIRRSEFVTLLDKYCSEPSPTGSWSEDFSAYRHG